MRLSEAAGLHLDDIKLDDEVPHIDLKPHVTKLLGDRPIHSYSSNEAAQFRDWCIDKGMGIKTVKRVFSSIRAIVNLAIAEEGLDCSNAFAKTYFPNDDNAQEIAPNNL
jgi:hypothetical protein